MSCGFDSLLSPHLFELRSISIHFHPFPSVSNQVQARSITFSALASDDLPYDRSPTSWQALGTHNADSWCHNKNGSEKRPKERSTRSSRNFWKRVFDLLFAMFQPCLGISKKSHCCCNSGCQIGVQAQVKKNMFPRHTLEAQVVTLRPQG